jgi:hypothetical protein
MKRISSAATKSTKRQGKYFQLPQVFCATNTEQIFNILESTPYTDHDESATTSKCTCEVI